MSHPFNCEWCETVYAPRTQSGDGGGRVWEWPIVSSDWWDGVNNTLTIRRQGSGGFRRVESLYVIIAWIV